MDKEQAQRLLQNTTFRKMVRKKSMLGWFFTLLTLLVYFSYIVCIGVSPEIFGSPVSEGATTTWGIYFGLFVIVFSIVVTGIYVYKANGEFERLTQEAIQESEVAR